MTSGAPAWPPTDVPQGTPEFAEAVAGEILDPTRRWPASVSATQRTVLRRAARVLDELSLPLIDMLNRVRYTSEARALIAALRTVGALRAATLLKASLDALPGREIPYVGLEAAYLMAYVPDCAKQLKALDRRRAAAQRELAGILVARFAAVLTDAVPARRVVRRARGAASETQ